MGCGEPLEGSGLGLSPLGGLLPPSLGRGSRPARPLDSAAHRSVQPQLLGERASQAVMPKSDPTDPPVILRHTRGSELRQRAISSPGEQRSPPAAPRPVPPRHAHTAVQALLPSAASPHADSSCSPAGHGGMPGRACADSEKGHSWVQGREPSRTYRGQHGAGSACLSRTCKRSTSVRHKAKG